MTGPSLHAPSAADIAMGAAVRVLGAVGVAGRVVGTTVRPAARIALHPPVLPQRLHPATWLGALGREGVTETAGLRREVERGLDVLVPMVLTEVLRRARLTEMVLEHLDVDAVVAAVDLDAAAARIDVDAVVRRADLDAAVGLVDLDAAVRRVDLDAILERADVDSVARRLDLDAVLDRLDLTALVLERVDLDTLVQAVLARIDLVGLAEEIIDAVDLPEIIRESTGSMASDTVRGARMQGIAADEAVGRAVDRLLLRRGRRHTEATGFVPGDESEGEASDRGPDATGIPAQADRSR